MSWLQKVSGMMGRRPESGASEAIRHAAAALETLDENCQSLGSDVAALHRKQTASDTLLCEHEWALTALRDEIEALQESLQQVRRKPKTRRAMSQRVDEPHVPHVPPSDLHGFLTAMPQSEPDEDVVAAAVRTLVAAAWTDLRRDPIVTDRFPWHAPILLLASAPADRLEAFLDLLARQNDSPALWLIGRRRDQRIAQEKIVDGRIHFVEYAAPGPFAVQHCRELLPGLRDVPFGGLVFLDTGLWGDRLEHCSELLQAIAHEKVYCFGGDDRLYHLQDSPDRTRALQLTRGLLTWYDTRLVPAGEV
jgi:hypothetical protein